MSTALQRIGRTVVGVAIAWMSNGCAFGHVRAHEVDALGCYQGLAVRVAAPLGVNDAAESAQVLGGVEQGLASGGTTLAPPEAPALIVQPRVTLLHRGTAPSSSTSYVASLFGDDRMTLELWLYAPGNHDPIGRLVWTGRAGVSGDGLMASGSAAAGRAFADDLRVRRRQLITRRAADERFVLTPSAQLLEPGEVVVSDDEVLLVHAGVGLLRWLQLDVTAGALPIPAAGGVPFAGRGEGAGGVAAAGAIVLGALDVGLKLRLHEESEHAPGVSFSYDMLDLFGAAFGGAGMVILGNGVVAAGGGGGANLQFNVFTLATNKHFGERFQMGGGLTVVDNHHFLPQGEAIVLGEGGAAGSSAGGEGGSAALAIDRMPTKYVPFVNAEVTTWKWLRVIQEAFPGSSLADSMGVTGLRFVMGSDRGWGPFSLTKVKMKLDLAIIETYHEASEDNGMKRAAHLSYLPWIGLGFYFM